MTCRRGTTLLAMIGMASCGSPASEPAASPDSHLTSRFEEVSVTTPDSVDLYVRVVGVGPDTVIIGAAAWLARDFLPLAEGRTLIFYDTRSRGGSEYVSDARRLGIDLEVRDIETIREHFGVSQVSVIGWSFLGAVSALYAARYPGVVRSVVQVGPMAPRADIALPPEPRGSPASQAELDYLAELATSDMPEEDPVAYCREVVSLQLLRPMLGIPDAATRALSDPCVYWNEWPSQLFSTINKFIPQVTGAGWDYSAEAMIVRAPVLTVHGTADPNAAVEGGREWSSLIPNARLVELEGVGHGPWLEAPEEFFRVVSEFLDAR